MNMEMNMANTFGHQLDLCDTWIAWVEVNRPKMLRAEAKRTSAWRAKIEATMQRLGNGRDDTFHHMMLEQVSA